MSYCRWSCDKFQSDVYAYEDCMGGYTIHVRGVHPVNPEILPEFPTEAFEEKDVEAIEEWMDKKREAYPNLIYKEIGLENDNQTLGADNLEDLHGILVYLRDIGYHVPESAFEMIDRSSEDTDLEEIQDDQIK